MKYRIEIDGLRAIAVIPVILFHAGFELFSGGFVGVDIFFVISGYLITTIILIEKETGKFKLVNFYSRRARRILPVLFFIIAFSTPFSFIYLYPNDFQSFAKSIISTSTFTSNIFFWLESSYFDVGVEYKPLLHTWSLAVEEQFYVLFPLAIMLFFRFGNKPLQIILGGFFLLSLVLSQFGSLYSPTFNFYMLPTRGWELLIGSFVAFYLLKKPQIKGNQLLSLIGLLLITYSVFEFDKQTPFPSLYALVPTIGTALILLYSSTNTISYQLLSNKFLVYIGLISYSAYLWHQPIFALTRHAIPEDISTLTYIFLILLTLGLSVLTYKFIENPFRKNKASTPKQLNVSLGQLTCSSHLYRFNRHAFKHNSI
jgi:peptidoglycan/LPS O-acetylase OafA/YrhL